MKNKNKINMKKLGLVGTLSLAMTGCSIAPHRISLDEANNYKGSLADYAQMYSENESTLDASKVDREVRCLNDLVGINYNSKKDLYSNLEKCVGEKRTEDMLKYLAISGIIDGGKLAITAYGIASAFGATSSSSSPVYKLIGVGSSGGFNGGGFN